MPILFAFTLFALLDFVILFSVGAQIGLLMTLLLILGTGFLGLHLVRREGLATFQRAQQRLAQGEIPSSELMTGAALIFGGALLMAPGFLSDALGFMCLLPTSRRFLGKLLSRLPFRVQSFTATSYTRGSEGWSQQTRRDNDTLDQTRHDESQDQGTPLEGDFISKDEPRY
ncbi:FxsA family protein [Halomonas sp. McH1-25]|uniref:FxsA family protein n=1 Tax=unclassified Halomonas TaxID=2609666 RepID=UPI001EF65531|nr:MULTISPECIES: FxsA family protein [unclassified Halomonas]MCG7598916.1 FxsA family protein [Halomonas sp. McH1-25]MCP1344166.1 FxsA family protein [Halomonas sp. FL8]MCP1363413.1 FxsA family protein [Halomonas sp. BBD45]